MRFDFINRTDIVKTTRGAHEGEPADAPPWQIFAHSPPVKYMRAHKLRYSDSDYSGFSSDILKENVKRNQEPLNLILKAEL